MFLAFFGGGGDCQNYYPCFCGRDCKMLISGWCRPSCVLRTERIAAVPRNCNRGWALFLRIWSSYGSGSWRVQAVDLPLVWKRLSSGKLAFGKKTFGGLGSLGAKPSEVCNRWTRVLRDWKGLTFVGCLHKAGKLWMSLRQEVTRPK